MICTDCLNRDGPIYNELETYQSDSELLMHERGSPVPDIPPRERSARKEKDPIYERVRSLKRDQRLALRNLSASSEEGSYITSKFVRVKILPRTVCYSYKDCECYCRPA